MYMLYIIKIELEFITKASHIGPTVGSHGESITDADLWSVQTGKASQIDLYDLFNWRHTTNFRSMSCPHDETSTSRIKT
jgi:hypothetical protein